MNNGSMIATGGKWNYLYNGRFYKQGPALYAYNNAVFTTEDWTGIRMVHDSVKVDDPMKVGRFGLGFKSVFHMTGQKFSNSIINLSNFSKGRGSVRLRPHRVFDNSMQASQYQ